MENQIRKDPNWLHFYYQARDWEYGTVHTHEEIELDLAIEKQTPPYYAAIGKANQLLLQRDLKYLSSETGKGYRVLPPNQHITESRNVLNRANRQAKKAVGISLHTNLEELTDEERKTALEFMEKQARFLALAASHDRETALLAGDKRLTFTQDVPRLEPK